MQSEVPGLAPEPTRRRRGTRSLIRAALVAAAAVLTFGLTAASASAAPVLNVSETDNLVSGQTVNVSGEGFVPPTPAATSAGVYVAQTAVVDGELVTGSEGDGSIQWVRSTGDPSPAPMPPRLLNIATGEFPEVPLVLHANIRDGDGAVLADCRVVQCYLSTWQAHGLPTTLITNTPINFIDRRLLVDPRSDLASTGFSSLSVAGSGFDPVDGPSGFRVAQAQVVGGELLIGNSVLVKQGADPNDDSQFELSSQGSFFARLQVSAFLTVGAGSINCESGPCSIVVWPDGEVPSGGSNGNLLGSEPIAFSFDYNPVVNLSQRTGLDENTDVSVQGSGFPAGQPGLYVTQAAFINGQYFTAARDTSGASTVMKFLMPGSTSADSRLNPDGTFATAISVSRNITLEGGQVANCLEHDCRVITWRAHSNPSRATVYTSTPITFQAAEKPAAAVSPRINLVKQRQLRLNRRAQVVRLGAVICGSEHCQVQRPARALLRVGKQSFRVPLATPRRIAKGKRALVRLRVSGKAARLLAGRRARVRFRVVVRSESGQRAAVVNRVLVGAPKRR